MSPSYIARDEFPYVKAKQRKLHYLNHKKRQGQALYIFSAMSGIVYCNLSRDPCVHRFWFKNKNRIGSCMHDQYGFYLIIISTQEPQVLNCQNILVIAKISNTPCNILKRLVIFYRKYILVNSSTCNNYISIIVLVNELKQVGIILSNIHMRSSTCACRYDLQYFIHMRQIVMFTNQKMYFYLKVIDTSIFIANPYQNQPNECISEKETKQSSVKQIYIHKNQ